MVDINIPVLKKDEPWDKHISKLKEESKEAITALDILSYVEVKGPCFKTLENAVEDAVSEIFDLIEVCIGHLDKIDREHPGALSRGNMKHIEKLHSRGWEFTKWLKISED